MSRGDIWRAIAMAFVIVLVVGMVFTGGLMLWVLGGRDRPELVVATVALFVALIGLAVALHERHNAGRRRRARRRQRDGGLRR